MIDLEDILRKLNTVERRVTHLEQLEHGASDRGAQGEQGEAGPAGPAGPQGEPGEACCVICVARYTTNVAQSCGSGSYTRIDFEDEDIDTHDAVTVGAGWKFEPPFDGYYLITSKIQFEAKGGWDVTENVTLSVFVNGAAASVLGRNNAWATSSTSAHGAEGSDVLYLETTDDVCIGVYQNSGGAIDLNGLAIYNHVAIYGVNCVECP